MLGLNKLGMLLGLSSMLTLQDCGLYQGADDIDIDPSYGPTQITQCDVIMGVSYEDITSSLAAFADVKKAKFVDSLYLGVYESDLQIDDPYVIINNVFYPHAEPPQHVLTFHEAGGDPRAEDLRRQFYDGIEPFGSRKACSEGNFHYRTKRDGWRLSDKHQMPKPE